MSINRLSRREFLKLAGIGGIELLLGPLNKVMELLGQAGETGNIAQRAAKFENLTRETMLNPNPVNQELLGSFLKFNAAELELRHRQQHLAADLMKQFLYGDGQPKDISREYESLIIQSAIFPFHIYGDYIYPESLRQRFSLDNKPFFSEQGLSTYYSVTLLNAFNSNHLGTPEKALGRVKVHAQKDQYKEIINNDKVLTFTQTITTPDGDNDAIFNALHNYSITVSGEVHSKRRIKGPHDLTPEDANLGVFRSNENIPEKLGRAYYPHTRLQMNNARIGVYDVYDFSNNPDFMNKLGHSATGADVFKYLADGLLGSEKTNMYWNLLPESVRNYLWKVQLIELQQHKAATLLTENKKAYPFPITATLDLYAPLSVPLFDKDLDFEP